MAHSKLNLSKQNLNNSFSKELQEKAKQIFALVANNQFEKAHQQLTFLQHRNKLLFNEIVHALLAESNVENMSFQLRLKLFQSEQKLNEQKVEDCEVLLTEIVEAASKINDSTVLVLAFLQQAVLNLLQNKQQIAIEIFKECELLAANSNSIEVAIETAIYGYHLFSETDAQLAGKHIYRALSLAEKNNNRYFQAYSLMHLGTLNTILKNDDLALGFFEKSFELFKQMALNICMADNFMCRFNNYFRKKQFEKAIECLEKAIELGNNCGWDHKVAVCYGNLSFVYGQLKNYSAAKHYAEKDIELSTKLNNQYNVGVAKFRLGNYEAALGNYESAIALINESLEVRKNRITNAQRLQAFKELMNVYASAGDFENAFRVQSDYMKLNNEILDNEKAKETEALRAKYEAEKREAELREARLQQTESELKALKAQMNPHFIFNALNSIQEIFFLGDKRLANRHLSRFSLLMRSILKASGKKTISLQEEIEMLEEYLSLEALRFGASFSFKVEVDENVDTYIIELPPMIIQPFLENAVKHGLMHKDGDQKVAIKFCMEAQDVLKITITDNGIGRKASAVINQYRKKHESFSTSATEKRFEILNQFSDKKFSFEYNDLESPDGKSNGTEVIIFIPVSV